MHRRCSGPGINQTTCTSFMERHCRPEMQRRPMMMDAGPADNQTVAAFLIARPPIGYLGWGWVRRPAPARAS